MLWPNSPSIHPGPQIPVWTAILILILVPGIVGCGGGDDGVTIPPVVNNRIGPEGGTASSTDNGATLIVPAGALTTTVDFSLAPTVVPPAGGLAGTCYDCGPQGTNFAKPVALSIAYDSGTIPPGHTAGDLQLASAVGGVWVPLSASDVDSTDHNVTGSVSHLSTYGIIAGNVNPSTGDSLTVILVDSPAPTADDEFSSLPEAISYLQAHLAYQDLGVIVWRTRTPQDVSSLMFLFDLRIDVETGYSAAINGPVGAPLTIAAGGAVNLSELTIGAPGGLILNANRKVALTGVHLPTTTAVNIGGVKGVPCPAAEPGFIAKSAAAKDRAAGSLISNCDLGEDFALNLGGGSTLAGDYRLVGNQGNNASVAGSARLSGTSDLEFLDNALKIIDVDVKAEANAAMSLVGNTGLDNLNFASDLTGTHQIAFQGNVAAAADIKLAGLGSATVTLTNEKITNGNWKWGLSNLHLDAESLNMTNLAVVGVAALIEPQVAVDFVSSTITQNMQIDLMDSDAGHLTLGLDHVSLEDVAVTTKYEVQHQFDNVTVSGHAKFTFHGNLVDWSQSHCTYDLGAQVEGGGVAGGVSIRSDNDHFNGNTSFIMPTSANVTVSLTNDFLSGGGLWFGPDGKSASRVPQGIQTGDSGITLDGVDWEGQGYQYIDLEGLDVPVTVTDCDFSHSGDPGIIMSLVEMGGAINIHDNTFGGGGLGVTDCPGTVAIKDNQIATTSPMSGALGVGGSGPAVITGNTVHCGSGGGGVLGISDNSATVTGNTLDGTSAITCCTFGDCTVTCDDNDLISGLVVIIAGQVHMSGNTFANAQVLDEYPEPGLLNDPVQDNDGLDPNDCFTHKDWDGNGCCDYPPEMNVKDENGQCPCEGVGK